MILVHSMFEIWKPINNLLISQYKHVERIGRVCYRSEDKITETSYKGFIDRLINMQHYAMLEHGTLYLKMSFDLPLVDFFLYNKYSFVNDNYDSSGRHWAYITTNLRVCIENHIDLENLKWYMVEPGEFHEKRVTVHFTCDRGVSHEFVRHRVFSFAQESTRYCNYQKGKFNSEITYIIPTWLHSGVPDGRVEFKNPGYMISRGLYMEPWVTENEKEVEFFKALEACEDAYLKMVGMGCLPQEARQVLPNALKTELVITGFIRDWKHFFELRALGITGKPHPDAKALAFPLYEEFQERGLI